MFYIVYKVYFIYTIFLCKIYPVKKKSRNKYNQNDLLYIIDNTTLY